MVLVQPGGPKYGVFAGSYAMTIFLFIMTKLKFLENILCGFDQFGARADQGMAAARERIVD